MQIFYKSKKKQVTPLRFKNSKLKIIQITKMQLTVHVPTNYPSVLTKYRPLLPHQRRDKITLEVEPSSFIANIKANIEHNTGIPADQQRLLCAGRKEGDKPWELLDGFSRLSDYKIMGDATLHLYFQSQKHPRVYRARYLSFCKN